MALPQNPLQPIIDLIPKPLRNRYFIVLILFFGWMVFVDKHDVLTQFKLQRTVNKLEADKTYYEEKIEEAQQEKHDIEEDKEKFAREKYYMKKKGEDVFIIEEKED